MIAENPLILHNMPVLVQYENVQIRNRFMRKIYTTLTIQIMITYIIFRIILSLPLKQREELSKSIILILTTALLTIIFIGLAIFERTNYPRNLIYLILLSFFEALTLSFSLASISQPSIVKTAFKLTAGIFGLLTMFTFQNRFSIDRISTIFFISFLELLLIIFVSILNPYDFYIYPGYYVILMISIVIFCFYIVFDTVRVLDSLNEDEWVLAVIILYFDFLRLFMKILELLSYLAKKNK
ncbi:protein lifeguard [Anaeramoeba ignava]|uniref:Protein lifeguard n=1 Tax=Anaeramoeba ignava TaxID=1746090 RepID=A0A9Q0LB41_ANAIG|nr:protein lifeguard [Anaeramoeba ignava]